MAAEQQGLGEQMLNKVIEMGISTQLEQVDELDVKVKTDPGKLLQGEVESVVLTGENLIIKEDLKVSTLEVATDSVAVNPLAAMFGKVELTQPADAAARIVLTETDLNLALNSDFLRQKLQNFQFQIPDTEVPITLDPQNLKASLPGEGRMILKGKLRHQETDKLIEFLIVAIPQLVEGGRRIAVDDIESVVASGVSMELIASLFNTVMELLDLTHLQAQGIDLQLEKLELTQGEMILQAKAQLEKLPTT